MRTGKPWTCRVPDRSRTIVTEATNMVSVSSHPALTRAAYAVALGVATRSGNSWGTPRQPYGHQCDTDRSGVREVVRFLHHHAQRVRIEMDPCQNQNEGQIETKNVPQAGRATHPVSQPGTTDISGQVPLELPERRSAAAPSLEWVGPPPCKRHSTPGRAGRLLPGPRRSW